MRRTTPGNPQVTCWFCKAAPANREPAAPWVAGGAPKELFSEAELRAAVAPFAAKSEVRLFQYYWALLYETGVK